MKTSTFEVRLFSLLLLIASIISSRAQLLVYENWSGYENFAADYLTEYGDQIDLEGTARILTKIKFDYSGNFYAQGDEKARLRIYANDGPFWKGNTDYPTPGTLLWDSGSFGISNGYHLVELVVPSIRAPDSITWTVQFSGLTMRTGITTPDPTITTDTAGLLFYGTPDIGFNYNDFWERLTGGWAPVQTASAVKNNFGASVTAIDEAIVGQTNPPPGAITVTVQGDLLDVSWPAASTGYVLQSRPSATTGDWTDEPTRAVPFGANFEVVVTKQTPQQIFRLREATKAGRLQIVPEGSNFRLRWPAGAKGYTLQASAPGGSWTNVSAPSAASGDYFEVVVAKESGSKLFRLFQ